MDLTTLWFLFLFIQILLLSIEDNLNGANVLGRTIKVEHYGEYLKREEEDEETKQKNREARGACRAFQRRECSRRG